MIRIALTLAGTLALAVAASAQSLGPLVLEGEILPGGGRVTGIESVYVDEEWTFGKWIVVGTLVFGWLPAGVFCGLVFATARVVRRSRPRSTDATEPCGGRAGRLRRGGSVVQGQPPARSVWMAAKPADVDSRSAVVVLRLRLLDWMWPSAVALAIVIALLGRHSGTYRIGSITYYANTYGVPLFLGLLAFAGIRWCWIGRLSLRDPAQRARGRLPIARLLLDLPGVLVTGYAVWIVAMLVLGLFGVIDLD
jgi:hypothetical protein